MKNKNIFLTIPDDLKLVRKTISQRLRDEESFKFTEVPAEILFKKAYSSKPDVIVIFFNRNICQLLKKDNTTSSIPIIAISLDPLENLWLAEENWLLNEEIDILIDFIKEYSLPKKKILIVDDNKVIHMIIKQSLNLKKYDYDHAYDGIEALEKIPIFNPDLIITDISMPRLNGFEFCKRIKGDSFLSKIPVLIVSVHTDDEVLEKGFEVGADDYITKPFSREQIISKVEYLLSKIVSERKEKILVVDDSLITQNIISQGLSQQGFIVYAANNGKEALKIATENSIDAIVSDIEMPIMNGYELCRNIKKIENLKNIPVIALTGKDSKGARVLGKKVGIDFYLTKPFPTDKLIVIIERFLANRREMVIFEREMLIGTISSLAKALDEKDSYTSFHSENVSKFSVMIAKGMDLPLNKVEEIRLAALLHDIGKIGIRDSILLKPGKLTKKEYKTIKQHSKKGAYILESIPSLKHIIPIIRYHHERFDGKGYPDGLTGETIPIEARIISVSDTYDALTSERAYRKKVSPQKAIKIIEENTGTQLCPFCVGVFLKVINQES